MTEDAVRMIALLFLLSAVAVLILIPLVQYDGYTVTLQFFAWCGGVFFGLLAVHIFNRYKP